MSNPLRLSLKYSHQMLSIDDYVFSGVFNPHNNNIHLTLIKARLCIMSFSLYCKNNHNNVNLHKIENTL